MINSHTLSLLVKDENQTPSLKKTDKQILDSNQLINVKRVLNIDLKQV